MKYVIPIVGDFRVTQKFGDPRGGYYLKYGLKAHNGWDLAANRGMPLIAPADGQVMQVITGAKPDLANQPPTGNYTRFFVQTEQSDTFIGFDFMHQLSLAVTPGQQVVQGQYIGAVDSTGDSTGDHLHFGGARYRRLAAGDQPGSGNPVRSFFGVSYEILDYGNGYHGAFDIGEFFDDFSASPKTPAALRYGQPYSYAREAAFALNGSRSYAIRKAKETGVYNPTWWEEAYNGLIYGYWNIEVILEPSLYALWAYNTKIAYEAYLKDRSVELVKPVPINPF